MSKIISVFFIKVSPLVEKAEEVSILTSLPASSYRTQGGEKSPENKVYSIVTSNFKGRVLKSALTDANILTGIPAGGTL